MTPAIFLGTVTRRGTVTRIIGMAPAAAAALLRGLRACPRGVSGARRALNARGSGGATEPFDRALKLAQRTAALSSPHAAEYEYLRGEVAERLTERLEDLVLELEFPTALDLGCGSGHVRRALGGRGGVQLLVEADACPAALAASAARTAADAAAAGEDAPTFDVERVCADETALPFAPGSLDLVLSSLALHWVNDLPEAFAQIRRSLRPDGLFLGAMLGGETLHELRNAWVAADLERRGGVADHASPLTRVADVGDLLQSAGFALTTVDSETVTFGYDDPFVLMDHLQGMGEAHAPHEARRGGTSARDSLLAAAAVYASLYAREAPGAPQTDASAAAGVPATFEIIYMIGWAPHGSQPRPLSPGAARASLKDLAAGRIKPPNPPSDDDGVVRR